MSEHDTQKWSPIAGQIALMLRKMLQTLHARIGSLPDYPENQQFEGPVACLDYAEGFAENDTFWEEVDERVMPTAEELAEADAYLTEIVERIQEFRAGVSRNDIREEFRRLLNLARADGNEETSEDPEDEDLS